MIKTEFKPLFDILNRVRKPYLLDVAKPPNARVVQFLQTLATQDVLAGGVSHPQDFDFVGSLRRYPFDRSQIVESRRTALTEEEQAIAATISNEVAALFHRISDILTIKWVIVSYGMLNEDLYPQFHFELQNQVNPTSYTLTAFLMPGGEFEWRATFGEDLGSNIWMNSEMIKQTCEWLGAFPFMLFSGSTHDTFTDLTLIWCSKPSWRCADRVRNNTFAEHTMETYSFESIALDPEENLPPF